MLFIRRLILLFWGVAVVFVFAACSNAQDTSSTQSALPTATKTASVSSTVPSPNPVSPTENSEAATSEESAQPSIDLNYEQKLIEKYANELKDVLPAVKAFCARQLNTIDNPWFFGDIKEDLKPASINSHAGIIQYGITGNGMAIQNLDDGSPAFVYLGTYRKVIGDCIEAIRLNEEAAPGFLKTATENGLCLFYQFKYDTNIDVFGSCNELGVFAFNCNETDIANTKKYPSFIAILRSSLLVESLGCAVYRLGGEYGQVQSSGNASRGGYVKMMLSYYNCSFLYKKTGDKIWEDTALECKTLADGFAKQYGLLPDEISLKKLVDNVQENNWVKPFGAVDWKEIKDKV